MAEENEKIREEEAMAIKNLPEVLIVDILSRLPVKSLLRFSCVCKSWCALIVKDPVFIKLHLSRSLASNSNLSLIFSGSHLSSVEFDVCEQQEVDQVELDHPLKSPRYRIEVLGSCNGLLCISRSYVGNVILWNPSTRRHQKLPIIPGENRMQSCTPRELAYGFGYNTTTEDYKVVRIRQWDFRKDDLSDNYWYSEVNVYELSTNSWRSIGNMPLQRFQHRFGFLVNSAIHWLAESETIADTVSSTVISFDFKDEEFREVPLPDFVEDNFDMRIGVLGGELCVICNFVGVHVELWVMKHYGAKESWVKQFSIEQSVIGSFDYIRPICYSKIGEVLFEKDSKELVLYDSSRGRAKNLIISGVYETATCIGSLVLLDARDGPEHEERKKKETE
ncbi:F-box protein CPR1-like [Macadamia integrifolia]|uniref:F-box protein CPR1-like n=1 Tax=Macadamia integrifolia TaxID=60698 RepID=UPI001C4E4538|nr:F-box protein CPR1-like [Macadamia integrifolia]